MEIWHCILLHVASATNSLQQIWSIIYSQSTVVHLGACPGGEAGLGRAVRADVAGRLAQHVRAAAGAMWAAWEGQPAVPEQRTEAVAGFLQDSCSAFMPSLTHAHSQRARASRRGWLYSRQEAGKVLYAC